MKGNDETIVSVLKLLGTIEGTDKPGRQIASVLRWRDPDEDDDDDPPPCPAVIAPMPRLPRSGAEVELEAA